LELYAKKEKIDGFRCDHCNSDTEAVIKPLISHLPDVLVLHLKRFNFISGYLDKIEDLVTYPMHNLDMSRYLISGIKQNSNYELYAIINHHMYQTGGHYTSYVQLHTPTTEGGTNELQWVFTNDSQVSTVHNLQDLVKKDAYMLYYKRKELTPSNIIKL
jgi:ubiquitin C-terminal hydrolase